MALVFCFDACLFVIIMTHVPTGVRGYVWKWVSRCILSVTSRPTSQTCNQNRSYREDGSITQRLVMGAELRVQSTSGTGMLLQSWEIVTFHNTILLVDIPSIIEKHHHSKSKHWHPFVEHTNNLGCSQKKSQNIGIFLVCFYFTIE